MDKIIVLDFGSQYSRLIATEIRKLGVYCEVADPHKFIKAGGYIFSGSPYSVYEKRAPRANPHYNREGVPILGLCYGLQLIAQELKGRVKPGEVKEFGKAILNVKDNSLFRGLKQKEQVWMSHGDSVETLPRGFEIIGSTKDCRAAAIFHSKKKIFGLQFHPEVTHTPCGIKILENFIEVCGLKRSWTMSNFIEKRLPEIQKKVKNRKVLVLMSGGVDSTVTYALLNRTLGEDNVLGLHIDTGLQRKNETQEVIKAFSQLDLHNIQICDASSLFLEKLRRTTDPEEKRNIIGNLFIQVLRQEIKRLGLNPKQWVVAQGTIYPDTIETARTQYADRIKTHHNRVPGIEELIKRGALIEPLELLFKDEVREVGLELGLPEWLIWRHPFPGPGLAVRIICNNETRRSDQYPQEVIEAEKRIQKMAQEDGFQAWILPVDTVGVQGDQRTYAKPLALQGPADWERLEKLSTKITNHFQGTVNRVWYLVSPSYVSLKHLWLLGNKYITEERVKLAKETDSIATTLVKKAGYWKEIWQMPVPLIPLGFTPWQESCLLRPVHSENAMTCEFAKLPWKVVQEITRDLLRLEGIGLVFYDLTHKPPGTIELE